MRSPRTFLALTVTLAAFASAAQGADSVEAFPAEGVWRNPQDSVHLQLRPCGDQTCGFVVWANERARNAARRAGTGSLVGQQLLRDFPRTTGPVARGKVFVPDLNATFSGSARRLDDRTLKARGCVLGNLICKSQVWTRIDTAPVATP